MFYGGTDFVDESCDESLTLSDLKKNEVLKLA
jgi:hypothetical protein